MVNIKIIFTFTAFGIPDSPDLRVIFKNHIPNMDNKHFQSAKRPFSVIFNSKPTNQVIRYEHEGQVSAKIMLEQKADFFKIRLKLVNARSRATIQKCQ